MSKINVAIIYGGRSTEHEISLLSAQNIIAGLDLTKYEPVLIAIDKRGKWFYHGDQMKITGGKNPREVKLVEQHNEILISQNSDDHYLTTYGVGEKIATIDVIWPVLHGTFGEDGAIQGFAKLANLPCVGPGILGSAMGMDKEVMKRILRDEGIKSAPWITLRRGEGSKYSYQEAAELLGSEIFVKPVNLGSSVGISFVQSEEDFQPAIDRAFRYDNKVLLESRIIGREIECAVLGNSNPIASIPGEVIPKNGFYSFESKYIDEHGASLEIPAILGDDEIESIKNLAIRTFVSLECSGMARVDMFLSSEGVLYINEINTLPGFTDVSMYPTLLKLSGIDNQELIDQLIKLAIEEHEQYNLLQRES
jgi:D-alanine-D-alanine ligase